MDIRLAFVDFWTDFTPEDNVWIYLLRQNHNVVIDNNNPNLVISMRLSRPYPNAFTIYVSNEPFFPDPNDNNIADHFIGNFYLEYPNYTRFPSYYTYVYHFLKSGLISDLNWFKQENRPIPNKDRFCSYISRSFNGKRGGFFHKLREYKSIDCNVAPYNNIEVPYDNSNHTSSVPKINFIKNYKFNLAFENNYRGHHPAFPNAQVENGHLLDLNGMITEKLIEPLIAGVIPIYWGNKDVYKEFNPNTFINYHDFHSEDDFIKHIIEVDNNQELYNSYFKEAIITDKQNDIFNMEYMINCFEEILKKI